MQMGLMRQLESEHKQIWASFSPPSAEMAASYDCSPALLSGWTDRNISLWEVDGLDGKPSLQDILVALCRKRTDWVKISYLRFPEEAVKNAKLSLTASNGNTGDQRVDLSRTHFEIKGITGKELCTLLYHISIGPFETGVFTKKDLERILFDLYDSAITRPIVQSATSRTSSPNLPTSGTAALPGIASKEPEHAVGVVPTDDRVLKPSSSTAS